MSKRELSTAGAVPVKNEKGQISMEKVKVQRYISGRKPKFADVSSSEESDEDGFIRRVPAKLTLDVQEIEADFSNQKSNTTTNVQSLDRRLMRLLNSSTNENRRIVDPEVIETIDEKADDDQEVHLRRRHRISESDEDKQSDDYDLMEIHQDDEDEDVERRHTLLKKKFGNEQIENEYIEDNKSNDGDIDEESEEDSEDNYESEDDTGPLRLKPVFVRKQDRISLIQQEQEEEKKLKEKQLEAKMFAEERHKNALKMIESIVIEENVKEEDNEITADSIAAVKTDDENEEVAYLNWKMRELQRNKRDKEEREELIRQKEEVERLRNMTEEERLEELKKNPKVVINKSEKGKFKFMQKYYHRGAFFMDKEEDLYKRDYTAPTLEDHFDKSILPKVMQVKNFGLSGRTKHTHLVDQDTTKFDSPWTMNSAQTSKFYSKHAAGMKQEFERPSKRRRN